MEKVQNNVVKQDNSVNLFSMKNFTQNEMNIMTAIYCYVKNQGTNKIKIRFKELKKITNDHHKYQNDEDYANAISQVNNKIINANVVISFNGNRTAWVNVFSYFVLDTKEKYLEIGLNEDFAALFTDLQGQFTQYLLMEYVNLKGKYAKRLFVNLKQFKTMGWWQIDLDSFKERMGYDYTSLKRITEKIVKPAVEELKKKLPDDYDELEYYYLPINSLKKNKIRFEWKKEDINKTKNRLKEDIINYPSTEVKSSFDKDEDEPKSIGIAYDSSMDDGLPFF